MCDILYLCAIKALGGTDASIYVMMAVTLYYGMTMLARGAADPGEIVLVVMAMLSGGVTVGMAFQQIDHFNFAISAANEIFPIIDRVSGKVNVLIVFRVHLYS